MILKYFGDESFVKNLVSFCVFCFVFCFDNLKNIFFLNIKMWSFFPRLTARKFLTQNGITEQNPVQNKLLLPARSRALT